jgi:hypothetical protein
MEELSWVQLDTMLQDALGRGVPGDDRLGSLAALACIFPATAKQSLSELAALRQVLPPRMRSEGGEATFNVRLGTGQEYAEEKKLHQFFTGMLFFESSKVFTEFVKLGYSLVVTAGPSQLVVAAASFIIEDDGLFVDAIAVSHGTHPDAYKPSVHGSHNNGNWQRYGLGSFLLAIISRCATLACTVTPAVYLRADMTTENEHHFYRNNGFKQVATTGFTAPDGLFKLVPEVNRATSPATILMVQQNPSPTDEVVTAALSLTGLNVAKQASVASKTASVASKKQRRQRQKAAASSVDEQDIMALASSDDEDATPAPSTKPAAKWTLPSMDFWQPQTFKSFKGNMPTTSHQLSQKEVVSKYADPPQHKALGRKKVLQKAAEFKKETKEQHTKGTPAAQLRHSLLFLDQQYINYAAVSDLHRPVRIDSESITKEQEVLVSVSSYLLPADSSLETAISDGSVRADLQRSVQTFLVSLAFLMENTRPDVAVWLQDICFGTKVQRIPGAQIGTDVLSLSFSGTPERDKDFLALPQAHLPNTFSPTEPTAPSVGPNGPNNKRKARAAASQRERSSVRWSKDSSLRKTTASAGMVFYDIHGNATQCLHQHIKAESRRLGVKFAPPPPKANTQVVKLKWVPSPMKGKDRKKDGVWRGAYTVRLGSTEATTVFAECGLLSDWVETEFAPGFRSECIEIAGGNHGVRNSKRLLYVPAGDVHTTDADPPPATELLDVVTEYQQGDADSCLRDSLASALAAMGFAAEATVLASEASLLGCNVNLVERTAALVRKLFGKVNFKMKKLSNHRSSLEEIQNEDAAWPIVLILQSSDGCYGSHAVTAWKHMIFDSNCAQALRWSKTSLDWCSGPEATCLGFSRAYRLCPENEGNSLLQSPISIGMHVRVNVGSPQSLGWISRLPSKRKRSYGVRHTDGLERRMSEEGVVGCLVPRSKVGDL